MSYAVKELHYTLQGKGANAGRPAVFCRFAGCNLWSGREEDRASAVCQFCDTDFVGTDGPGGGRFVSAAVLSATIASRWPAGGKPLVVFTGGEPFLQIDAPLVDAMHGAGFEIAVETNGTLSSRLGIDWVCVSPKANTNVVVTAGQELKLVYPQFGTEPEQFVNWRFDHFFLQPMDGPFVEENTRRAVDYCLEHPRWELSLQTHKFVRIP
jgi:7-carboxy-7-deazaguanine synthase (Cx14CxxC type)